MSMRKAFSVGIIALAVVAAVGPRVAFADMSADMKALDPDSDGTVSLAEAQDAAAKKFTTLDPDKDGTVDKKEAKGNLPKKLFKKADPDGDGTVDKTEYSAIVESIFKKADKDGDGTLDAKELDSKPGKKLLKLIQ